jgi:hypothetical protein
MFGLFWWQSNAPESISLFGLFTVLFELIDNSCTGAEIFL